MKLPGYRYGHILRSLDSYFYALTARDYDRELSTEVIRALEPLYEGDSEETIDGRLAGFIDKYRDRLSGIYREHEEAAAEDNAFVFQPESILIFERIAADPFALKEQWGKRFDVAYLEPFFNAWGLSLD